MVFHGLLNVLFCLIIILASRVWPTMKIYLLTGFSRVSNTSRRNCKLRDIYWPMAMFLANVIATMRQRSYTESVFEPDIFKAFLET